MVLTIFLKRYCQTICQISVNHAWNFSRTNNRVVHLKLNIYKENLDVSNMVKSAHDLLDKSDLAIWIKDDKHQVFLLRTWRLKKKKGTWFLHYVMWVSNLNYDIDESTCT